MIIERNTTNKLIFTGSEKGVLINPYYLIELIKDDSKNTYYCIGVDVSTNPTVYNQCDVIEVGNGTANAFNSELKLTNGFYTINFYEQASSTNLNPAGLTKVESKKLRVIDVNVINPTQEYNNTNTTTYVYNG